MTWIAKVRTFTGRFFLGTHDAKFVVTHDNKKILLFENAGFTSKPRNS